MWIRGASSCDYMSQLRHFCVPIHKRLSYSRYRPPARHRRPSHKRLYLRTSGTCNIVKWDVNGQACNDSGPPRAAVSELRDLFVILFWSPDRNILSFSFSFNKHAGSIILQKLLAVSKLITDEAVLCQFGAEANYGFVLHDKLKQGFAQRFL